MKSKIKFIVIIAVVVLLLGGAAIALTLTKPADEGETEAETEAASTSMLLYDKNPKDIDTVTIKNATSEYKVERVGNGDAAMWTVFDYLTVPVDGNVIDTILKNSATVTAQEVANENAADLSIYGLDKPRAEVKVEFTDSSSTVKELLIGNVTPTSSKSYMCFKGESKVYTVFNTAVSCFVEDKSQCVNKTLYTAYTSTDTNDTTDYNRINKMTIKRKDLDYDIVIEYDKRLDNPDIVVSNSSSYRMTAPVTLDLNPDKSTDITNDMFGLTASSFEVLNPTAEDKTKYGFDDPTAVIDMDIVGGKFSMTVGNEYTDEESGQSGYYVIADGIDVIYIVSTDSLPWVTFKPLDITTLMITSNYIYGVSSLNFESKDNNASFTMTGSEEADYAVKLDGADVDKDSFKTLYQFILKAPAEQLCFDEVSGEPTAKITIKSASGNDTIEFYNVANRRSVIKLNGKSSFSCKTAYVERLIENVAHFKNGETLIMTW